MESFFDFILYLNILNLIFVMPLCIMAWFTENTVIGQHLMDFIMRKLGLDDLPDFDDDDDDYDW